MYNANLYATLQSILMYSSNFVIDALSMARNNILVRTYFVGGPNERNLPPESLSNVSSFFQDTVKLQCY